MDIDPGSFQTDFLGSPVLFGAPRRTAVDSLQASGDLMRYHSAPSSMLVSLVDEDFFPRDGSAFAQGEESEFAPFLSDDLGSSTSLCDSRPSHQTDKVRAGSMAIKEQHHSNQSRKIAQQAHYMVAGGSSLTEDVNRAPLSAIFENGLEESIDRFCSPPMPVTGIQQAAQSGHQSRTGSSSQTQLLASGSNFSTLSQAKNNLIRHSSSPADFLSRLIMEESSEQPTSGSYMRNTLEVMPEDNTSRKGFSAGSVGTVPSLSVRDSFSGVNKADDDLVIGAGGLESQSGLNRSDLVRQSSSPAGLLSQLSLDGISAVGEKLSMSSSSGNSSEEGALGASLFANYGVGGWDEGGTGTAVQNFAVFGQRKRGRHIEAKLLQGLSVADSLQRCAAEHNSSPPNHVSIPATTSPGSAAGMERSMMDAVPCRARAKRGCATHPRSIAERVRRTKISERMRKLQGLVPNMDKQTDTADMLNEAVEYVKFLQRQVQELSENQPNCNGMCHQKGNATLEV